MATEKVKLDVTFLAHHGVTGQKWGVRRYQEKDGSLTPEGRQHWGIGPAREKIKLVWKNRKVFRPKTEAEKKKLLKAKEAKKAENEKKREENAAKRAERNKAALDAKREKLIREGDPKTLYKNRKLLSDEDLDRALNRIDKLKGLKPEDEAAKKSLQQTKENRQTTKDGKEAVDKLISIGKTAISVGGTLVGMYESYNKIASVVNELTGQETMKQFNLNPWKKFETKDKKDNEGSTTDKDKSKGDNSSENTNKQKSSESKNASNSEDRAAKIKNAEDLLKDAYDGLEKRKGNMSSEDYKMDKDILDGIKASGERVKNAYDSMKDVFSKKSENSEKSSNKQNQGSSATTSTSNVNDRNEDESFTNSVVNGAMVLASKLSNNSYDDVDVIDLTYDPGSGTYKYKP